MDIIFRAFIENVWIVTKDRRYKIDVEKDVENTCNNKLSML
jgi:hypothetical protein